MQKSLKNTNNTKTLANMKVCHIIINLASRGGAECMLVRQLLADTESAHNKMLLVLRHSGVWGDDLLAAGVTVHELKTDSILAAPRAFFQLIKFIKSFQPDIVQTWMYHADFLGSLAARMAGYKNIVWSMHRTSLSLSDSKITTIILMKLCALMSYWIPKKIIHVANAGRLAHIEAGYNADRIVVIPNGFDFSVLTATDSQRKAFRDECKFSEKDLVIGCLARFHPAKGHDNFINAAAIVVKNRPDVKFMIAGSDCDAKNIKLNGWIKEHYLQDSFVLLGERHDVAACLSSMDIFCMPSLTEAFPIALGEAMAMGLPCVATNVGDTAILVGDTAILVPAQDAQALAQGLLDVINLSEKQRHQMGLRSKERVVAEFSIDTTCKRYDNVYSALLNVS
jgi:glycosyltransferase involved in cell wall biosynthesis